MTTRQMIQRVAKVIRTESFTTVISDNGNDCENIYRVEFYHDRNNENERMVRVLFYDEDELVNPFHDGEMFTVHAWLGASTIVDMIKAVSHYKK